MNKNNLKTEDIKELMKKRKPGAIGKYKFFSVLVPLVEKDGQLHLLYEVRSKELTTQPGEICFPGGALEENETKRQCAVRETCEELGIKKKDIKVIGQLDSLHTYSNFTMYCYLGMIDYETICKAKINQAEVSEIFLVPLERIINEEPYIYKVEIIPKIGEDFPYDLLELNNGYNWRRGQSEVPIYLYEDRIIWGLTARITHSLADLINENSKGE